MVAVIVPGLWLAESLRALAGNSTGNELVVEFRTGLPRYADGRADRATHVYMSCDLALADDDDGRWRHKDG